MLFHFCFWWTLSAFCAFHLYILTRFFIGMLAPRSLPLSTWIWVRLLRLRINLSCFMILPVMSLSYFIVLCNSNVLFLENFRCFVCFVLSVNFWCYFNCFLILQTVQRTVSFSSSLSIIFDMLMCFMDIPKNMCEPFIHEIIKRVKIFATSYVQWWQ